MLAKLMCCGAKSKEIQNHKPEEKELDTPLSCISYEINIMRFFGLYPFYGDEKIQGNRLIYLTKYIVHLTVTALFITSIWMNIFVNFSDSNEVIETLYFGLTETTFVVKLINFHLRFYTYKKLEAYLTDPIFTRYTSDQQKYIAQAVRIERIFATVFRIAITITILFFIVFPYLDKRYLVIPSYFPFSVERYHFACYLFQLWGITINGYVHSSLDCIVAGLITIGSAQFEILKDNLNHMRKGLEESQDSGVRDQQEVIVLRRLGACVEHHVKTIRFAFAIENMFSFIQFVQFLASSIIICVTGFQIIVTPFTDLKFITLILYFSCNLIQVLMCCWFGHDITTKSEGVGEACYMSEWYVCGSRVARSIFIIMERSKRPIILTAGKFFGLTLQTLMQVLKTSYSYLALLRRMNEIDRL